MSEESFPNKWLKKLPESFKDSAETMSDEELEKQILTAESKSADTEHTMNNDEKLKALQDECKEMKGGYTDAINCEKAKIKYCLHLLRLRGKR